MLVKAFIVFLAIDLLLLIFVLLKRQNRKLSPGKRVFFYNAWQKIEKDFDKDPHRNILEADKLINETLNNLGYSGTFGEKLKKHPKLFSKIDQLWYAHKLRNRLAHELNLDVSKSEYLKALKGFRIALRDLGIIK